MPASEYIYSPYCYIFARIIGTLENQRNMLEANSQSFCNTHLELLNLVNRSEEQSCRCNQHQAAGKRWRVQCATPRHLRRASE